ncbi:MAG: 4Fe-4S binding protein [Candidatus Kariarchaeaceae archaeon]
MKENVESVSNCIQCGECEDNCPYNLPIRGDVH